MCQSKSSPLPRISDESTFAPNAFFPLLQVPITLSNEREIGDKYPIPGRAWFLALFDDITEYATAYAKKTAAPWPISGRTTEADNLIGILSILASRIERPCKDDGLDDSKLCSSCHSWRLLLREERERRRLSRRRRRRRHHDNLGCREPSVSTLESPLEQELPLLAQCREDPFLLWLQYDSVD